MWRVQIDKMRWGRKEGLLQLLLGSDVGGVTALLLATVGCPETNFNRISRFTNN